MKRTIKVLLVAMIALSVVLCASSCNLITNFLEQPTDYETNDFSVTLPGKYIPTSNIADYAEKLSGESLPSGVDVYLYVPVGKNELIAVTYWSNETLDKEGLTEGIDSADRDQIIENVVDKYIETFGSDTFNKVTVGEYTLYKYTIPVKDGGVPTTALLYFESSEDGIWNIDFTYPTADEEAFLETVPGILDSFKLK